MLSVEEPSLRVNAHYVPYVVPPTGTHLGRQLLGYRW